jgi:hypothetical protein
MLRKSKKKVEEPIEIKVPKEKVTTSKDKIDNTISEIQSQIKTFRNEEVFVCLQDCLKKIENIKRDHGN